MKYKNLLIGFLLMFCFTAIGFTNENINTIERKNYNVQIKQYDKKYPVIVYVIFEDEIPLLDEIKKILKSELLIMSKKEGEKNNIIASAWFDNKMSGKLEKIELSKNYSAFIWVCNKDKTIMTFSDYINYLKKKKEKDKKKEKLNSENNQK
ncbi:MAG: hypothetical protein PHT81_02425 [Endomicrobiaceae bacterium]|nr:hypothetical protein [Endomicrobiaceae bacterium]MDD5102211.1 hypothetical protein [Endomicrobiaceae bacterium]